MEDKYMVAPRADGKSTLQLARALGVMCSIVYGVSETEGCKIALEALTKGEEDNSV